MQALVLLALVISCGFAARLGRAGALLVMLLSLAWIPLNHSMEGPTLIAFNYYHGVSTADMASLGGLVVAVYAWFARRR